MGHDDLPELHICYSDLGYLTMWSTFIFISMMKGQDHSMDVKDLPLYEGDV